jgi:hypothetical protein
MKRSEWKRRVTSNFLLGTAVLCGLTASAYGSVVLSQNFNELTP